MTLTDYEPMTTCQFFAHVQAHGFNGWTPGKNDPLGDSWSRKIGADFDRVCELGPNDGRHTVWLLFQWLYCMLARQTGRTIASPPAMRAAGIDIRDEHVSAACRLLILSAE